MRNDLHHDLNPQQRDVVENALGPCLVLAGAGSGKTKTIVHRVAELIGRGVNSNEILLLTFTNKAALEMMSRCEGLLGHIDAKGIWGGTFHRIANKLLRTVAHSIGFTQSFTILDEDDRKRALKQAVKLFGDPPERPVKPEVLGSLISVSANTLTPIEELAQERFSHTRMLPEWIRQFSDAFQARKRSLNAMDFDDLLTYWLKVLREHDGARSLWSKQFRYILVDEYQDVNLVQDAIVMELSRMHHNLLVVGDDAQSIYGFRGADVEHIRAFPNRFHGARVFPLTINYRSRPEILSIANAALKRHVQAFRKELSSSRPEGGTVELIEPLSLEEEAQEVIHRIHRFQEQGVGLNEQAILFRATASSATIELELQRAGIPYILRGGVRFFEQAHIKDMISCAKVLHQWHDELAWMRIAELLPGVGPVGASRIWKAIESAPREEFLAGLANQPALKTQLAPLIPILSASTGQALAPQLNEWLNTWYRGYLEENYDDAAERFDDCIAFISFISNYTSADQLFSDIALSERFEKDNPDDVSRARIVCSTIHQAKGLEWSVVYLIGFTDGSLPHYRSLDSLEELEEERRLLYVAITRAKDHLIFSAPREAIGGNYALPSRFLEDFKSILRTDELDDDGLPVIDLSQVRGMGILDKVMMMKRLKL